MAVLIVVTAWRGRSMSGFGDGSADGSAFARRCSEPLRVAHLCAARPARMDVYGGRSFVDAFLGVKGSPVQIRPSRRRSRLVPGPRNRLRGLEWERTCAPIRCADQTMWRLLRVHVRWPGVTGHERVRALARAPSRVCSGELPAGQGVASSAPAIPARPPQPGHVCLPVDIAGAMRPHARAVTAGQTKPMRNARLGSVRPGVTAAGRCRCGWARRCRAGFRSRYRSRLLRSL
jgi:hypothetical protein